MEEQGRREEHLAQHPPDRLSRDAIPELEKVLPDCERRGWSVQGTALRGTARRMLTW